MRRLDRLAILVFHGDGPVYDNRRVRAHLGEWLLTAFANGDYHDHSFNRLATLRPNRYHQVRRRLRCFLSSIFRIPPGRQ